MIEIYFTDNTPYIVTGIIMGLVLIMSVVLAGIFYR